MTIASDRRFDVEAPRGAVWSSLCRVDRYRSWWPWLHEFDGAALVAGERWHCVVKPALPYLVRFTIDLIDVVEGELVRAELSGDIAGPADLSIDDGVRGCVMRLRSELTGVRGPVRAVDRYAHPLAVRAHHQVLDRAIRQFSAWQ